MALFKTGQIVVYRNIGVCRIADVGPMHFGDDAPKDYYTLQPLYAKGNDKIYVPADVRAVLRPMTDPETAASELKLLSELEAPVFSSRNQTELVAHYQQLFQTNDLTEHLILFKEICQKERLQKSKGRKLSAVDQHFYQLAEQLLSEEFSLALKVSPAEMRETLHTAALSKKTS